MNNKIIKVVAVATLVFPMVAFAGISNLWGLLGDDLGGNIRPMPSTLGSSWATTSTDYWKTQNNFFSTTSTDYWETTQPARGGNWATTSTDYWKSVTDLFSTTSTNHLLTQYSGDLTASNINITNVATTSKLCFGTTEASCMSAPAIAGSQITLYPWNLAVDIPTYEGMRTVPDSLAEVDETCSADADIAGGYCLIDNYVSTTSPLVSGPLILNQIPAGTWTFNTFSYVNATAGVSKIEYTFKRRTSLGVETELFQATSTEMNNTAVALTLFQSTQLGFTWSPSDRLVFQVKGWTDSSSAKIIHYVYEDGQHYSNITTPITIASEAIAFLASNNTFTGNNIFSASTTFQAQTNMQQASTTMLTVSGNGYFGGNLGIGTTSPYAILSISNSLSTPANTPLFNISSTTGGTLNSTLFTVLESGNVGIGTSSPGEELHIFGSYPLIRFSHPAGATNLKEWRFGVVGSNSFGIQGMTDIGGVNLHALIIEKSTGHIGIGTASPTSKLQIVGSNLIAASSTFSVLNSSSASMFHIQNDGNIGIGTTTPNQKLSIFNNAADSAIEFSSLSGSNYKWAMGLDYTNGNFVIASSSVLGTNNRLVIDGSGNITIGALAVPAGSFLASDPTGKIIATTSPASSYGDTNVNAYIHASTTIPKTYTANTFTELQQFNANASSTGLTVTGNTYLATTGGYVGIGTTSPLAPLHVYSTADVQTRLEAKAGGALWYMYGNQSTDTYLSILSTFNKGSQVARIVVNRDGSDSLSSMLFQTDGTATRLTVNRTGITVVATTTTGAIELTTTNSGIKFKDGTYQYTGFNLGNANTWTGLQQFNNSTSTLGTITTLWSTLANLTTLNVTGLSTFANASTTSGFTATGYADLSAATVKYHVYQTFAYSTSTTFSGTTTIALGVAFNAEKWNQIKCYTDVGTVNISIHDGTDRMNLLNASTTIGTFGFSTNNTFTASEKRYIDIGTPVSSPQKISCTTDVIVNF